MWKNVTDTIQERETVAISDHHQWLRAQNAECEKQMEKPVVPAHHIIGTR